MLFASFLAGTGLAWVVLGTMATAKPLQARRKIRHVKAFGYLLNPSVIYRQALENGTACRSPLS